MDERQEQQADTPEAVVDEEQLARVDPVGQPAAPDRADEVEHAHDSERRRCRDRRETVVDGVRDEVLPHQSVRRRTADEEGAGQEPEIGRPDRAAHHAAVRRVDVSDLSLRRTSGPSTDVGWVVLEPEDRRKQQRQWENAEHDGTRSPAGRDGECGQHREEHQLPGTRARTEDADDEATVLHEPSCGDGRAKDARDETGAEAGEEAEEQRQLPDLACETRREQGHASQRQADENDVLDADAAHQPAAYWACDTEDDESRRCRERHRCGRPARLARHR